MAGDWIKMRADLQTHPKVVRMVSALKADKLRVIGGLHAVWSLFDAHSDDGTLDGYTVEALDDYIGWPGFCAAMIKIGWLEDNVESLATPRFDEHNGQSAKRRATETQRKRLSRSVPEMSAPNADKKRSREEKRREDIEGDKSPSRAAKKCPADFTVTAELSAFAAEKCPLVDAAFETEKFRDCTFKTARSDWPGTWRNWMRKAQQDATEHASRGGAASFRERDAQQAAQRASELAPGVARRTTQDHQFLDVEAKHVAAIESH